MPHDKPTERIVRELIACTLAKIEWTHHAHLRVGLWHALNHADPTALNLLRERIRCYNESTGVPNTSSSGYHETVTGFYVRIIRLFLMSVDHNRPLDELGAELIARFGGKELPMEYYTRERLFRPTRAAIGWNLTSGRCSAAGKGRRGADPQETARLEYNNCDHPPKF